MEIFSVGEIVEIQYLRADPDELLLETIEDYCRQRDLRDAVVLSTVGSLSYCRIHIVKGDGSHPVQNRFIEMSGSIEIVSMSGIIADYEPHLHMCIMRGNELAGGHLEPGCKILTMAEIAIGVLGHTRLKRVRTPEISGYHYKNLRIIDSRKDR